MKQLIKRVLGFVLARARDSAPTAVSASVATLASSSLCGWAENRDAVAPVNAIAHVFIGERAFEAGASTWRRDLLRLTIPSIAWNTLALWGWAFGHNVLAGPTRTRSLGRSLACGALVSLGAYVIDYKIVGPRWTPGIEAHLSGRSMFVVYVALGLGLGLGGGRGE